MSAARAIGGPVATVGTAEERALARTLANVFLLRLPKSVLREDIHQAALIGLWDGIQKLGANGPGDHTPEQRKGYLITRIRGHIIDELRHQDWLPRRTRQKQATSPTVTIVRFDDLGRGETKHDWEELLPSEDPSPEDACVREAERHELEGELQTAPLNPRHRHILRSHYWRGTKFADIAAELGVSEPRVSQQHAQAIGTLRAWNSGVLPEQPQRRGARLGTEIRREARLAILKKHQGAHDHRAVDRRAGDPAGAPARPGPFPCAVPKRWLGGAPAAAAGRPVPRRAGRAELGRQALPGLCPARSETVAACAPDDANGGLPVSEAAALASAVSAVSEPSEAVGAVPSVLPEGFQMESELARYRDWMIGQALAVSLGNRAEAARRLGINRTTLVEILRRTARERKAAAPPPAPPSPGAKLVALAERIPWDLVAMLRAEGKNESRICRLLANLLESHPFTIEKALKLPRPLAKCGP